VKLAQNLERESPSVGYEFKADDHKISMLAK
jgi:hypothetical protein